MSKMYVQQLFDVAFSDPFCLPLPTKVTLVAHVVRTSVGNRYEEETEGANNVRIISTTYHLEDGTGSFTAYESQRADSYEERSHHEPFYARFVGRLKESSRGPRLWSLSVWHMRRITDPNEIYLHIVDAMSVSSAFTRKSIVSFPISSAHMPLIS